MATAARSHTFPHSPYKQILGFTLQEFMFEEFASAAEEAGFGKLLPDDLRKFGYHIQEFRDANVTAAVCKEAKFTGAGVFSCLSCSVYHSPPTYLTGVFTQISASTHVCT